MSDLDSLRDPPNSVPSDPSSSPSSPPSPVVLQNATNCYNSSATPAQFPRSGAPDHRPARPPRGEDLPRLLACVPPLSSAQSNAIELLISGCSDAQAARQLKVHRVTVTRWRLYNHIFQAELNRRRQEVWGASADQVRNMLRHAIKIFKRQLRSDDPALAFRAAHALLDFAGRNRFAPPDAPVDPHGVLDLYARQKHIEISAIDPKIDPLHDDDRARALHELLLSQHDPSPDPDPSLPPTAGE